MGVTHGTAAREYLRVSLDKSGRQRSNREQQVDNRRAWSELTFGDAYEDVSISASRYSRRVRDGYGDLIADLRAGRFGADVLVLWEGSRGSRRVGEWVELIELCEQRLVHIAVTEDERTYDPANPRDRKSLLENATDAEYESAKISARTKRAAAAGAAEGRAHGKVNYGYRSVYDPDTGNLIGRELHPTEAPVIAELFERIERGHSLRSIADDFAKRGIKRRDGEAPFSAQHLRSMLTRDAYRGKRIHVPGRKGNKAPEGVEPQIVDAQWPAIVPERRWLAVQAIITDPSRRTSRDGRAKHLLSMIARCDVCDSLLNVAYRRGRREYQCWERSCVRIGADELDDLAEREIVAYLSRDDNVARLTADDENDEALDAARLEVAKIKADLDELADKVGRRELSPTLAARAEPPLLEALRAAEARRDELATPSTLRGLIQPGKGVGQRWKDAPVSTRRTVARMLLAPDVLGQLRLLRSPTPHSPGPAEDRVRWRTEHAAAS